MRKIALLAAVMALSAGPAFALDSFDGWAGGTTMSGSANNFNVEGSFRDMGAGFTGLKANGWNEGSSSAGASFEGPDFESYANSYNSGGMNAFTGGLGSGHKLNVDFSAQSFGQSLGEIDWHMEASDFSLF